MYDIEKLKIIITKHVKIAKHNPKSSNVPLAMADNVYPKGTIIMGIKIVLGSLFTALFTNLTNVMFSPFDRIVLYTD